MVSAMVPADLIQRLRSHLKLRPRTTSSVDATNPQPALSCSSSSCLPPLSCTHRDVLLSVWPSSSSPSPSPPGELQQQPQPQMQAQKRPQLHKQRQKQLRLTTTLNHPDMSLTDLPLPVFLDIARLLSPRDVVRCRRVCSRWRAALCRQDLAVSLALAHFPRAREARLLRRWLVAESDHHRSSSHGCDNRKHNNQDDEYIDGLANTDWPQVYARLASRYFHLTSATPRAVSKIPALREPKALWGVAPWNRFLKLESKAAEFQHWDPVWAFAPQEGLLVYPASSGTGSGKTRSSDGRWGYRARDLETGVEVDVPFDTRRKIVRRVRLADGVLLFEWCEERGSHPLSTTETAHRHYATAYDVVRDHDTPTVLLPRRDGTTPAWPGYDFVLRAEWKIHLLGMPLSHQDRFFSAHNRSHYAVYIWQPTRSPWGKMARWRGSWCGSCRRGDPPSCGRGGSARNLRFFNNILFLLFLFTLSFRRPFFHNPPHNPPPHQHRPRNLGRPPTRHPFPPRPVPRRYHNHLGPSDDDPRLRLRPRLRRRRPRPRRRGNPSLGRRPPQRLPPRPAPAAAPAPRPGHRHSPDGHRSPAGGRVRCDGEVV